MNTIKNCHSPAGMTYSMHGARNVSLKDCPKCKYGTMDFVYGKGWVCADCGAIVKSYKISKAQ